MAQDKYQIRHKVENNILKQNIREIISLISQKNNSKLKKLIKELHNADIAEIIQNLDDEIRLSFILNIQSYFDPEILTYLNESIRNEIIENLDIKQLASNASELDVDDAVDVIQDLEDSDKKVFLDNIPEIDRQLIKEALLYPKDSAGRLMQREYVCLDINFNVGNAIDFLRKNKSELPITHPEMTRFFLTLEDAVEFVSFAFQNMTGGEIFVKKLNAIKITTLARLINPLARHKIVGIREGEKIHEQMIGVDDSMFTVEFKNHYEILPNFEIKKLKIKKKAKKVKPNFLYSSSTTGKIDSDYLVKKINEIKKSI